MVLACWTTSLAMPALFRTRFACALTAYPCKAHQVNPQAAYLTDLEVHLAPLHALRVQWKRQHALM